MIRIGRHITNIHTCCICIKIWGQVTHIYGCYLTIIGSGNGLSPGWRQAMIWINAGIVLTVPLGIKICEILIKIHIFSLKKMYLKMSSRKWWLFRLGLNIFIIGSGNGLSPVRRQPITWTNAGLFLLERDVTPAPPNMCAEETTVKPLV